MGSAVSVGDLTFIAVIAGLAINLIAIFVAIYKLGLAVGKFEKIGEQQASEITQLKEAVKGVGELITKLAVQTQRQDVFSERLNRIEKLLDDMRRGEGYILPLQGARPSPGS